MRRKQVTCFVILMLALVAFTPVSKVRASSYGLYGTVRYTGGGVVSNATVEIWKQSGSSYVYIGSTLASACGYYTYDTGGTGNFRIIARGTNVPLRADTCGNIFAYESVAGDNFGSVTWWTPLKQLDVTTA